jgi:hypothetical protein
VPRQVLDQSVSEFMAASILKPLLSILLTFCLVLPGLLALDVYTSAELNRALEDLERGNSTAEIILRSGQYRLDREYKFTTRAFRLQISGPTTPGSPAIIHAKPRQCHLRIDHEGMELIVADVTLMRGGHSGKGLAGGRVDLPANGLLRLSSGPLPGPSCGHCPRRG